MPFNKKIRRRRRITRGRTLRNKSRKSAIKTYEKKFKSEVENKDFDLAKNHLSKVSSLYDKAAKVGSIHKNQANRKKSRLTALYKKSLS